MAQAQRTEDSAELIRTAAMRYGLSTNMVESAWNAAASYFGPEGADDEIEVASRARILVLADGE